MKLTTHWFQELIASQYSCRLAQTPEDLEKAQMLRFQVFNLELDEGLEEAFATGRDEDPFDAICDHLLVEDKMSGQIIGTYRLQSGITAKNGLGYYSEQEFDFAPFEPIRHAILELGRACIHKSHRNLGSLGLLWKGIAQYAKNYQLRYFIGCSSLTSQDPDAGLEVFRMLQDRFLTMPDLRTNPRPEYVCLSRKQPETQPDIPKLLRAYLTVGAQICGPPALDKAFGTIDFLTLLDLENLSARNLRRYF
jgi:putative hemolysin